MKFEFFQDVVDRLVSQLGGMVEIRDVVQRQIFLNLLSSSIEANTFSEFEISGLRIDSALSRTISISFENRNSQREARSSGSLTLEPMTLESW